MNIMNRFTLRTLMKNKVRTFITILGIVLSTAMFTAVTTMVISLQKYLVKYEISERGNWEGMIDGLTGKQKDELIKDDRIKEYTVINNVGYAELKGCYNEYKPYIFIESIDDKYTDVTPIDIIDGRMPKNDSELLISEHMSVDGGIEYKIGEKVTFDVGYRTINGNDRLNQGMNYKNDREVERFVGKEQQTYTVVGICKRPRAESFNSPGYTAFTSGKKTFFDDYGVFYSAKNAKNAESIVTQFKCKIEENGASNSETVYTDVHSDLLRFMGKSANNIFNKLLYSMAAILMTIIMVASISLIYNAFSISISERTKQFGMLKSIGATKKQMRKTVIFEAFALCVIGVPVGIISGITGIGITLHFVSNLMLKMVLDGSRVKMTMYISWQGLLIAALVAVITVIISALIPASRAVRMTAIQAIRQSNDTKIGRKSVRTPHIIYKLFGFEGMLGSKNFKRNKKKQRITVFSLAISIILFVSANSFSAYMVKSISLLEENNEFDIQCEIKDRDMKKNTVDSTLKGIKNLSAVDEVSYSKMHQIRIMVPFDKLDEKYLSIVKEYVPNTVDEKNKKVAVNGYLYYVNDEYYKKYLADNKLDVSKYMDSDNKSPLIWDKCTTATKDGILSINIFKDTDVFSEVYLDKDLKNYIVDSVDISDGGKVYCYKKNGKSENNSGTSDLEDSMDSDKIFTMDEAFIRQSYNKGEKKNIKLPLSVDDNSWNCGITMTLPYSAYLKLPKDVEKCNYNIYQVKAEKYKAAENQIEEFLKSGSFSGAASSGIQNRRTSLEANQAMISIVNIFSYGFIILISLIVISNVFNTISTNIQLRRKEFAMLKSVGMTRKGFDRMMNYECMLYGVKGILYGLPVAVFVTYLIYKAMGTAWNVPFFLPVTSIVIITISVFAVVFASMIYSMSKIKKDNPIEALRNDNV